MPKAAQPKRIALESLRYDVEGRVATITLNRPQRLNAISPSMPADIARAVDQANYDDDVHVIVLTGAGRAFCAGYDLKAFAEDRSAAAGTQSPVWDPAADFYMMKRNTDQFASLWRSYKPTIAKVRGFAVAGGSDIALCCDLVIMEDKARIGYPPARVWGVPTTAMWAHRVGPEKAKRMLFTGDLIDGTEAKRMGLVLDAVPSGELDGAVEKLARRIAAVPRNQLMMTKLVVNQAVDIQGLQQSQTLSALFDGVARHSPEGRWFKRRSEEAGFQQAVRERDGGEPIAAGVSKQWRPFDDRSGRPSSRL
eukprot:TRINITY_DN56664_c0_g1_i1.p1 TRINITY_DN56664_c0_g1~~TRINITY_DN56664_c0_g1_i1.p1  ORF type:complete len:308 (+),score=80.76 TRINITY_DN56664_c0_g1_i1:83-1006(+)